MSHLKQYILALQTGVASTYNNYLSVNVPFEVNKIIFRNIEAGNILDNTPNRPVLITSLIGIENEIPCNYTPSSTWIVAKSNQYEFYFNSLTPINGSYNFSLKDSLTGTQVSFHSLLMVIEFIQATE